MWTRNRERKERRKIGRKAGKKKGTIYFDNAQFCLFFWARAWSTGEMDYLTVFQSKDAWYSCVFMLHPWNIILSEYRSQHRSLLTRKHGRPIRRENPWENYVIDEWEMFPIWIIKKRNWLWMMKCYDTNVGLSSLELNSSAIDCNGSPAYSFSRVTSSKSETWLRKSRSSHFQVCKLQW